MNVLAEASTPMRMPHFIRETITTAKRNPLWGVAFLAAMLLPLMLIFVRAGIEVCGGIIGVAFLWHSFRTKQWGWLREPFAILCLLAWAWLVLVVTPLAQTPGDSVGYAVSWFRFPLMFVALRYWVLAVPAARTTLATLLAALLALIAIDCFWQLATGVSLSGNERIWTGRLTGPFAAPKVGIYISKLVVPVVALCLAAALFARRTRPAIASVALFALMLVTIILTGERSAFVITMLALGATLGLMMMDKRFRLAGVAACVAMAGLVATLYVSSEWVQQRSAKMIETMQNYSQSDYGMLANEGYKMGREHLLHGVGLRNYRNLCPTLYFEGKPFNGLHPHNAYIEWFAEAGLPGLLLFMAMIAALTLIAVKHLWGSRGAERLLPAVAVAVLLQDFFPLMGMQSFFGNWGAMLQWYGLGLIFAALPPRHHA